MNVIASWSGGKDCCLACYRATQKGHHISHLVNFLTEQGRRCAFHGINSDILLAQGEAMGIPMVQQDVTEGEGEHEKAFQDVVRELKDKNQIEGMVFGDIYLDAHLKWVEDMCNKADVEMLEPLWGEPTPDLAREFVASGFKAVIVGARAELLNREIIGRTLDLQLIEELEKKSICPCGEGGEFHTLVTDGPLFQKRLEIGESETVFKKGFWDHWSLDIKTWSAGEG